MGIKKSTLYKLKYTYMEQTNCRNSLNVSLYGVALKLVLFESIREYLVYLSCRVLVVCGDEFRTGIIIIKVQ